MFDKRPILVLALLFASNAAVMAQQKSWQPLSRKQLVKFDWNCAETSWNPTPAQSRILRAALSREHSGGPGSADRAFAFDLNGDRKPEYFVPLVCGATGNCTWAVLTANRPRLIGMVSGEYVYVHRRRAHWPVLITYGHLSVVEGSLATYRFHTGRYLPLANTYAINHGTFDLEIQGGRGHKMPLFLQQARAGCNALGY